MADKKITEADAITAVAGTDVIPVATPSVATAFKATFAQILTYIINNFTAATTSVAGKVQLSDSTSTTSSVLAATPTAVKAAYDLANGKAATNQTMYIGTTSTTINRSSATQVITGVVPVENVIAKGSTSGSVSVDWDAGTICTITMTGATTFTDSNASAGQTMVYYLKQDSTGSRTVTWPTTTWLEGGTAPTLTTTANKTDIIVRYYDGSVYWGFVGGKNG